MKKQIILPITLCAFVFTLLLYYGNQSYYYHQIFPQHRLCKNESSLSTINSNSNNITNLQHKIELTLRMTFSNFKLRNTFLCDFLRSAVVFWNASYGPVHLILDEVDKTDVKAMKILTSFLTRHIPLKFRCTFETGINQKLMETVGRRIGKSPGYVTQLYSSFLMDLYTDAGVIAWTDTDTVFTIPVLLENIRTKDGKLIVKGKA